MRRDGKRSKRFVFGLCAAVAALVVFACQAKTAELAGWSKRAEILVPGAPRAGVVEFALVPEVYAAARPDLGDLLVTDAAGQVVPHILRQETGSVTQEKRLAPASIINRVHSPKQFSAAVLDFGTPLLKSGVEIDTAGENFRRQVKVEASDDGQTWQVLKKSAWLFRIGAGRGADDRKRVELPDNNFRFLRVTVFHAPDDPEEVEIVSAVAWQVTKKSTPPDLVEWKIASLQIHTDEEVSKTTTVDIDVGYENLPFYAIELTVADENFMRSAEVLGRNRTTRVIETRVEDGPMRSTEVEEPWQHIATGTIHRFTAAGETDECLRLEANAGGGWRYLRVRIFNHDNPPLQISSARVWGINRYV
ncbi:MAG: DUF3999 domain-containing protein, partial [Planctomycetota bacterium]|nr:DUF3999 domain-containing protein [Planctomycetota bacterium]